MTLYTRDTAREALSDLHAWAAEWAEKAEGTAEQERSRTCRNALALAFENRPLEDLDPRRSERG